MHGLDRHSVDLDFDGGGGKRFYIESHVRHGLQDAKVSLSSFKRDYDKWKGQRFKVHYIDPGNGEDRLLKVESSFRTASNPDDVVIVDGIRTYKIPALFDQKLDAADDRTRARDLFDLGFLAKSYGARFSSEQILRADDFSRDYEGLADRYRPAFNEDKLLRDVTTADDRALLLRIAIIEQMHRRGHSVVEQAVPGIPALPDTLALHKIWLESDGQEGSRADLSERNLARAVLCGVNFERADLRRTDFSGADLRNANLRNTNLSEAVFDNTNLRGADFSGSDLTDVSLRGSMPGPATKGFSDALVRVAKPDQSPYRPYKRALRRAVPERDFGPSR